ncbi:hypothetical protein [Paenimyroides aestuarii]|uniref:Uncharacterized protein n=1 Tax=Paenimyroides aestuarii TaxID=2968490 RepID=A0ABY5NQP8_9FLAO|nr:hypothetical protein [Paenimyroides aestuarii]UUV20865.1 hypothetical protein NPX36_11120 [Paenimyroides aestuarii]
MKNKRILIGVGIFLLITFAGIFWLYNKISNIQENRELSAQIPSSLTDFFASKKIEDYPYEPQEVNWDGRFMLFDWEGNLVYNKQRNEALKTNQYFPNGEIKGIVLVKHDSKLRGVYVEDGEDPNRSSEKAYQQYYALSFLDLASEKVLVRDTIWGEEPKQNKREHEDQHGILPTAGIPSEGDLIKKIEEKIK